MSENSEGKAWYDTPEEQEKRVMRTVGEIFDAHFPLDKMLDELDEKYRLLEEQAAKEKDP
jgi:predicted SAM-dependent methyltransferase